MKTRWGFVSNSSSSSFILALPHKPKDEAELRSWMFFDTDEYMPDPYDNTQWDINKIVNDVFYSIKEIKAQKIEETIKCGTVMGKYKSPIDPYELIIKNRKPATQKDWDRYNEMCHKVAQEVTKDFLKDHHGKVFFKVEYEDGDVFGCAMEHGSAWDRLPHMKISHH